MIDFSVVSGLPDDEIVKSLKFCITSFEDATCNDCPMNNVCLSDGFGLEKAALYLINRQSAELEILKRRLYEKKDN